MAVDYAGVKILMQAFQAIASPYSGAGSAEVDIDQRLGAGTTKNQFDVVHQSTRDPGGTTAEDVDMRALTDIEGATMSGLTEIVWLSVQAPSTNTANYEIKGAVANAFLGFLKDVSDIIVVPPGEFKILILNFEDGKNVVGAATKVLNINNLGDANSTLTFTLLGRSA